MTRILTLDEIASAKAPDRLVGRKAAGLSRILALGLPVPAGFVVTTEVFRELEKHGSLTDTTREELRIALEALEARVGKQLGRAPDPLLVAVRSGAPVSMPGMLETVLNVGMNRETQAALAAQKGDERFALDCMRRFLSGFATTVLGATPARVEAPVSARKLARGNPRMRDADLDEEDLRIIVEEQRRLIEHEVGIAVPEDPLTQLELAVTAVMRSWHLPRAVRYRRMHGYGDRLGTACVVQAMVFGNLGADSGAGVLFTRHPSTGEPVVTGEYAPRGQGTDVVGGTQRPSPIELRGAAPGAESETLEHRLPDIHRGLVEQVKRLEQALGDAQEVEFAFERGALFLLQTRSMKRTARAAVRIGVDLVREGIVDEGGALLTLEPPAFATMVRRRLPTPDELEFEGVVPVARGLAASPGAASGRLVFSPDDAVRLSAEGEDVILVRRDTSPEDVHGVKAAAGLLTTAGGLTSHAAVVARGLGKCCVAGCTTLTVDEARRVAYARMPDGTSRELAASSLVTLDGSTGYVYEGVVPTLEDPETPELATMLGWADANRRLRVHAVAESPSRALAALRGGADGIGLLSTDAMLTEDTARFAARCLLLGDADDDMAAGFEGTLELSLVRQLEPLFLGLGGKPMVIRLFDIVVPALVSATDEELQRVADAVGESRREIVRRAKALSTARPGLGLRGVRLAITHPAFMRALVRAVLTARAVAAEDRTPADVSLVVPALATGRELAALLGPLRDLLRRPEREGLSGVDLPIGAVIGLPHACLEAREIAALSELIVFDTHELTQRVFAMGPDDSRSYLTRYIHELQVFDADPFVRFDETGVGVLIRTGAEQAREVNPGIKLEIAGDVAGEPGATALAETYGMNAVACPNDRMLVARISAAQAASKARSGQLATP